MEVKKILPPCLSMKEVLRKSYYFFSPVPFIASSKNLPGLNFTVVLAGIITGVPVFGLRARRLV